MNQMRQRAEKPTGNTFVVICNEVFWDDVQYKLADWLARFKGCNTYLWSKAKDGMVNVGSTFTSYEFAGKLVARL